MIAKTNTSPTPTTLQEALALRDYLRPKLLGLLFILLLLVTLSAPTAFVFLRFHALQQQSHAFAQQIADFVEKEAEQAPRVWRYDVNKLLTHLRNYRAPAQLLCMEIHDQTGRTIVQNCIHSVSLHQRKYAIWQSASIHIQARKVGRAWVAMKTTSTRQDAALLLLGFLFLALLLASLLYLLPNHSLLRAEQQLTQMFEERNQAQQELTLLNQRLESQVKERTRELHHAYQNVQQKELRLRELSNQALQIQEDERRNIARELHDAVGQSLTAIRLQLQVLLQQLPNEHPLCLPAQSALAMTDIAIHETRQVVQRLGPFIVKELGLVRALQRLCDSFGVTEQFHVKSTLPKPFKLPSPVENALYRIAQEALTNAHRHAQTPYASLHLAITPKVVTLTIQDRGVGFPPNTTNQGHGLANIQERCELLGGQFKLHAKPTKGTTIQVSLPRHLPNAESPKSLFDLLHNDLNEQTPT